MIKRKSECIKGFIIRRKNLGFYQKFNSNFKQGALTPLLVSHYIYLLSGLIIT